MCRPQTATGNRHIWVWAERSQLLSEGGGLPSFGPLIPRLHVALEEAARPRQYGRDQDAKAVWAAVYPQLTADKPGITGAITARGDAHALRLQLLYAGPGRRERGQTRACLCCPGGNALLPRLYPVHLGAREQATRMPTAS